MWTALNIHGYLFLSPTVVLGREDDPYSADEVREGQGACPAGSSHLSSFELGSGSQADNMHPAQPCTRGLTPRL